MKCLVTGSSGHLGEGLVRVLRGSGAEVIGLDIKPGAFTTQVGSVADPQLARQLMRDVSVVYHSATLHKPHVATHSRQEFVDTNVSGTLALLEAAAENRVAAFIFTSTTSVFGDALRPGPDEPAAWVTENLMPVPRNIYGATKLAAEQLCELFSRKHDLNCMVLRTSRFFPEEDDDASRRAHYADRNIKANEYLYRRVDLADVVSAHLLAAQHAQHAQHAQQLRFGRYIISATTPFQQSDVMTLRQDPASVVAQRVQGFTAAYQQLGWRMFDAIDRVYVNAAARRDLGWQPEYDFDRVLGHARRGEDFVSPMATQVGAKGYHEQSFDVGPYPV